MNTPLRRGKGLRGALVLGLAASTTVIASAPALAQDAEELETVIITGSRISRPNLDSTVPITTVSGDQLFETGSTSVGDLLNDMPALRSTFSQSNSSRFLGTTGLNLLDLRGLGSNRTLVLVNGRRHIGADILGDAVAPDTNTFPSDLIERIDVVTGGSSAVYGSDAIAGVVNFVLKRNFEGVQFRAQTGESKYGDGANSFGSVVAGTNFADDRGNFAVDFEFATQDAFFASDRPDIARNANFIVVDTDPAGTANGSDGIPDRRFINSSRATTISNGGLLQIAPTGGRAPCGRDAAGVAFVCTYLFNPDGSFVPQTGTRVGIAPNGNFDGGNGSTLREGKLLGLYPELERYSLNLIGRYQVSDAFEPFIEAKYVRTKSLREQSPAFYQGSTIGGGVDLRERPRFDNPFLSDSARTAINDARAANGLAPATAATRLTLRKNLADLGGRGEAATRETTRIVLGANGDIGEAWKYEFSLNVAEFKETTDVTGNLDVQRFLLAMDSVRDSSGNIVCRSQIDPAARLIYPFSNDDAFAASRLAADVAACVPLNPFGDGATTQAARDYLLFQGASQGSIKQKVASVFVSGNTSQWFALPAGPLGVALGGEYREEQNAWDTDDVIQQGITFYNAIPQFSAPKFKVKEVFGEVRVPVLADLPFAKELTLSAAGRVSSYDGKVGTVNAYNLGLDWAPIDSLRVRAGLARAVRAPNLQDLYGLQSQNFASVVDPCSLRNIGTGAATRAANCLAAGVPTNYDYVYLATLETRSGGNPDLNEETSESLTVGLVFQPEALPGLSVSLDYFDIDVNDVITTPTAQQILNACYDAVDINNQFCSLFERAGPGGAATGEEPFRIIEGSLQATLLNYAKRTARGVDLDASYKFSLGEIGQFNTRLVYTHMLERNNYLNPADPARADRVLSELGDPKDAFNVNLDYARDKLTVGYQLRYIGKQVLNFAEDVFTIQGRAPENADYGPFKYYPTALYHDLRVGFDLTDTVNVYVGMDNVTNKMPPWGLSGTGAGSGMYDVRGRYMYGGVKAKF